MLCWHLFTDLQVKEFWFHTGTGRLKQFLPVHDYVKRLGDDICTLLPAMHALTGCDSTSSLNGVGKKKAFSVLTKNKNILQDLEKLGSNAHSIEDETRVASLKFIGLLYNDGTHNLNKVRYLLFTKKGLDSSKFPPTEDSAYEHI